MLITSNVKNRGLFPEGIFGKVKDKSERKEVLDNVKKELEERKNYKPELTIYERAELGKKLIKASKNNDINKVIELINQGADLNVQNDGKNTALIWAVYNNHIEVSTILIEKGADLNIQYDGKNTALIWAVYKNNTEISTLLIEKGADLNVQDNSGKTALHYAIEKGNVELTNLLIERGAKIPFNYLLNMDLKDIFKYGIRKLKEVFA